VVGNREVQDDDLVVVNPFRRTCQVLAPLVVMALLSLTGCAAEDDDVTLSSAAADGRAIAREAGCVSCHGADGSGRVGPAWKGLAGSTVLLEDGASVVAETDYLIRSIVDPDADLVRGYTVRMPSNTLSLEEVASVVAYIEELQ